MCPKISVIVLNWNNYQDTLECVQSLSKIQTPFIDIVVVDNGSSDGSPQRLNDRFPELSIISNRENVGYAEGNNIGIRHALAGGAEYIFLLNNDTVVDRRVLDDLIEVGERDEKIGLIGPKIYDYYEHTKIWFAGAYIDWVTGESPHLGKGEIDHGQYEGVIDVDRLTGCAMLIKKKVFEKIGLLDADFFLYFEDVDFCVRAQRAGFKVVCARQARVWHKESATTRANANSPMHAYYHNRNRLLFLKKHGKILFKEHSKNVVRFLLADEYKRMGIVDYYLRKFGKNTIVNPVRPERHS